MPYQIDDLYKFFSSVRLFVFLMVSLKHILNFDDAPSSFLIVVKTGRNDEGQVDKHIQTASVQQQQISLRAAITWSMFDKTPK